MFEDVKAGFVPTCVQTCSFCNADYRSKRSKAAMMAAMVAVAAATAEVDTSNSRGIESSLKRRTQHGDKKGDTGGPKKL